MAEADRLLLQLMTRTAAAFHAARARVAGRDEAGASLVEYALLVALIAVVCIVAVQFIGAGASKSLSSTASAFG